MQFNVIPGKDNNYHVKFGDVTFYKQVPKDLVEIIDWINAQILLENQYAYNEGYKHGKEDTLYQNISSIQS